MGIVYKISNTENTLIYVGATKNITKRINSHKYNAFTKNSLGKIYEAMRLYGWDKFRFEILEICNNSDLFEREKHFINKLNSLWPNGYNLVDSQLKGLKRHKDLKISYSKKVLIYDLLNKENHEFISAKDACRFLNLSLTAVSNALYRKQFIKNRYVAKYSNDERNIEDIIKECENKKNNSYLHLCSIRKGRKPHNIKKVKLINIKTNEEIIFNSITDAAKYLNKQTTNISHACKKNGRIVGDHFAQYIEGDSNEYNSNIEQRGIHNPEHRREQLGR